MPRYSLKHARGMNRVQFAPIQARRSLGGGVVVSESVRRRPESPHAERRYFRNHLNDLIHHAQEIDSAN